MGRKGLLITRLQDYNSGTRGHMPSLAQRYDLEKNTTATASGTIRIQAWGKGCLPALHGQTSRHKSNRHGILFMHLVGHKFLI